MKKFYHLLTQHIPTVIFFIAAEMSIISFFYYFGLHQTTAYGDSAAHLNIARRVSDSVTPGMAQLGGYWLPLLHVLMLPTVWNDFFWQSGISGSIPNMIAFVISVVFIYKLVFLMTKNNFAGFIAVFLFLTNWNLLYMQTAPMTESLFISTLVVGVYYFYKWFLSHQIPDLVLAAFFFMLCSLNRYEGWMVVFVATVLLIADWMHSRFSSKKEGMLIVFAMLAWFGIALWLLWGAVILGDPLDFLHNDLSAGNQTKAIVQEEPWTGFSNLPLAFSTYIVSMYHTTGIIALVLFAFGLFVTLLLLIRKEIPSRHLALLILLSPLAFDVFTVYSGNVPMEVPELSLIPAPMNYFNIRYSLYLLPAVAVYIATLSTKRWAQCVILLLVAINAFMLFPRDGKKIVVLQDGGTLKLSADSLITQDWFNNHYDGGLILASTGGTDKYMYALGIHQDHFITETAYKRWDAALKHPAKNVEWVLLSQYSPNDAVNKNINKKELSDNFIPVISSNNLTIWKKK